MTEVEKQAEQWLDESPLLIQRELGKRLGITSHVVGRLLADAGLREDGRPTPRAFEGKFVAVEQSGDWPQYRWNERRIVPILRDRMNPQSHGNDNRHSKTIDSIDYFGIDSEA